MKLIFLDIDGVMNNWVESTPSTKHVNLAFADSCVDNLKYILNETGAKIVVSSSWRSGETVDSMKEEIFCHYGLDEYIVGLTPVMWEETRGKEINCYLKNVKDEVESFVILDDDSDMDNLIEHHVKTNAKYGLTKKDAQLAIKMLKQSN